MTQAPNPTNPTINEPSPSILAHIIELRTRLMLCVGALGALTIVCYYYVDHIFAFLIAPLAASMDAQGGTNRLIYTSLTEAFTTSLKLAFLTALFLTLPIIIIQVWKFVAPGLFKHEKKAIMPFFIATPVLFSLGAAMVYFWIMPLAWQFFVSFQTTGDQTVLPIQLEARIADYLSLIITLIFAFGLCFQLPVLLGLLARAGIVSVETLAAKRKYVLVGVFAVAAVITPPDVISQISLALPLYALYELSILMIRRLPKTSPTNQQTTHETHQNDD